MADVQMNIDDPELVKILGLEKNKQNQMAQNPFYYATQLEQKDKRKEAEKIYLELLNSDFDNCVVQAALGMNYATSGKNGLAVLILKRALDGISHLVEDFGKLGIKPANPDDEDAITKFKRGKEAEILNAIGTCYKHENNVPEARERFETAQSLLESDNADIQNNLGTLYINEGTPCKAMEHFDRCLAVDANHAQGHWNKSLALLELGHYEEGWPEYDWGMPAKVRMDRQFTRDPLPVWKGEKGARVVVYGEQGIGDEILFASCLQELIDDSEMVVFDCHKKLHRLFSNSFPGIDIYPTREDESIGWSIKPDGTPRYDFTHRIAIGSLPRYYRPNLQSFPGEPYISPTKASNERWRARLDALPARPNVGISWIGGHKRTRIEVRSMRLEEMLPILKELQDRCNLISLQYTPADQEVAALEKQHGIKVHHWPEATATEHYDDTAGLVANLDLVITVCTSLVHLAGSMGVPTWVLTPSRPAWRYRLDLDYMPWYSAVTLFRQAEGTVDWNPVIAEVAESAKTMASLFKEPKCQSQNSEAAEDSPL